MKIIDWIGHLGKIDCSNGMDEYRCEELEMNQCDRSSEHRCHDGQCVDNIEEVSAINYECSEQYQVQKSHLYNCYVYAKEECENQKCPPLHFSCGDGYCYDGPNLDQSLCYTRRDQRYLEYISSNSSSMILFTHIHLIIDNPDLPSICYNQTLCPYFLPNNATTMPNGLTCYTFERSSNDLVIETKRRMRSCSLLPSSSTSCPFYQCDDQSKCFSNYRLSDGYEDCATGEDEHQSNVCSYNLPSRFTCDQGKTCLDERLVLDGQVS